MTGLLALLVRALEILPLLAFIVIVPLISIPVALVTSSIAGLRRGHWMAQLSKESWFRNVLAGGVIRITVCAFASLLLTLVALPQLLLLSVTGWIAFAGTIILFILIERTLKFTFGNHFEPPFDHYASIRMAVKLTPILALGIAALGVWLSLPFNPIRQEYPLAATILVDQFISFGHLFEKTKNDWIEEASPGNGELLGAIIWTGVTIIFASGWGAILLLPIAEWRRGIAPSGIDVVAPRPTPRRTSTLIFVATIFFLFIWAKMIAAVELHLNALPQERRPVAQLRDVVRQVEQIAGGYFEPGTIEQIKEVIADDIAGAVQADRQALRDAINRSAGKMILNVDPFLDDYYSLRAEYERLLALSLGQIEESLVNNLTAALARDVDDVDRRESRQMEALLARPSPAVRQILDGRRVLLSEGEVPEIIDSCQTVLCGLDDLARDELQLVKDRLAVSGVASAGGAVAGKVVGKLVSKGVINIAAKALAKVAATKLVSSGVGATVGGFVGGALGSAVPVLGTAIGATGGGILGGLLTGVSVDALLVALDEYYGRETFRNEIVGAINEWRNSALAIVADAPQ